jgi:hypothetical protein
LRKKLKGKANKYNLEVLKSRQDKTVAVQAATWGRPYWNKTLQNVVNAGLKRVIFTRVF